MKKGNTSGVKSHYKAKHLKDYAILFEESSKQRTIEETLSFVDSEKGVDFERLLVCQIALKNLPISFFNDPETQNFFKLLNDDMEYPRRNALADKLTSHFEVMQSNFKSILQNIQSKMAFTVDAWWALSKVSYYAVTVHFVDDEWNLF